MRDEKEKERRNKVSRIESSQRAQLPLRYNTCMCITQVKGLCSTRAYTNSLLFARAPRTQANVSQAEYERAHKEYLTRLRRSAEGDALQRRLFTMHATGKCNSLIFCS